ncbi:ATP-dependent RNA helicase [Corynebacterium uterequi]|uniref:HrpA-like helicase n=1 Tax=Corynebacterium uterequi TaxID=1072256 RepID=A0A0G3H9Q0_9CORY|nr:ATP-dependent helicase C-terminal domain-containing protein [Corynebacterium uterequi]AKK10101.1 HrpA-like helicase [Corynebacterium uterequi]
MPSRAFDLDHIGAGLPVAGTIARLPGLLGSTLVVEAPPGTGKTTLLPPALANAVGGTVLVTGPRRVAVRAAARRLAQLDGSELGDRVGYSIRGEHRRGSQVHFMTPGVLLRRLLSDPELAGVNGVIVDEVHERQLETDLVLAMLAELVQLREDLVVVAMSATLDVARYQQVLGGAPVLTTPAVTHPLTFDYRPHPGRAQRSPEFYDHLAASARAAVAETGHSALVFVPGVREVERVVAAAGPAALPLHGRLSSREQDRALQPSDQPRIVVSTAVAESALTVPGVRVVVDSGLSRVPRRDAARAMTGLVTLSSAASTADQRAGRAGREGPGLVIRAYSESDYHHFAPHITPEIATSDLTDAALTLAAWGTPRGEGLPLLDAPPAPAITDAEATLRRLGAVDADGGVTDHGRRLAELPVDPRLGSALLRFGRPAADIVAVLGDSPRGDLARAVPDRRQVRRLAQLVGPGRDVSPGQVVAAAFPNQVARHMGQRDYLLASGTRARLPEGLGLGGAAWLAVAEVSRSGSGASIRAAARLTEEQAIAAVGLTEDTIAEVRDGAVRGRRVRRVGAIELSSTPVALSREEAAHALAGSVTLADFPLSQRAEQLRDRLAFLHATLGAPWPDISAPVDLSPEIQQLAGGTPIAKIDPYPIFQRLLPWPEAARLEELAPDTLALPSGRRPRIEYGDGRPVVRVKLQDCFGLDESPLVAGIRVQFHLLSPAARPLAVTDDLASFWAGPYQQVRKEMRGRYPKHPWPEVVS